MKETPVVQDEIVDEPIQHQESQVQNVPLVSEQENITNQEESQPENVALVDVNTKQENLIEFDTFEFQNGPNATEN